MGYFEDDYIVRAVRHFAQIVANLVSNRRGAHGDTHTLEEIEDAYGELFGFPRGLLDALDVATVAGMVQSPERLASLIELLDADATIAAAAGDAARAERRQRLADGLRAR